LESGEETLARLGAATGMQFHVATGPGGVELGTA
jgi:hypothetical protein